MSAKVLKAPAVVSPEVEAVAAEALRRTADEAYERGRQAGRAEATADLETAVAQLGATMTETAAEVTARTASEVRLDGATIAELAVDLAGWFIGAAVEADPGLLSARLHEAMATLVEEPNLVLSLAPEVATRLEQDPSFEALTIRPDPTLGASDFRLIGTGAIIERNWAETIAEMGPDLAGAIEVARHDG